MITFSAARVEPLPIVDLREKNLESIQVVVYRIGQGPTFFDLQTFCYAEGIAGCNQDLLNASDAPLTPAI